MPTGQNTSGLYFVVETEGGLILARWSYLVIAIAAIYRSAFTWFKWYFGLFATLGTGYREHLAMGFTSGIGAQTLGSS